jgi:hypothetical protein
MTDYNPRDRVKRHETIEGVVTREGDYLRDDKGFLWPIGVSPRTQLTRTVEIIKRALQPEPADGSIVTDKYDDTWQRAGNGWVLLRWAIPIPWTNLNESYGPITILREGGPS